VTSQQISPTTCRAKTAASQAAIDRAIAHYKKAPERCRTQAPHNSINQPHPRTPRDSTQPHCTTRHRNRHRDRKQTRTCRHTAHQHRVADRRQPPRREPTRQGARPHPATNPINERSDYRQQHSTAPNSAAEPDTNANGTARINANQTQRAPFTPSDGP